MTALTMPQLQAIIATLGQAGAPLSPWAPVAAVAIGSALNEGHRLADLVAAARQSVTPERWAEEMAALDAAVAAFRAAPGPAP